MIFHVETLRIQTYCEDPTLHRGNGNLNLKKIFSWSRVREASRYAVIELKPLQEGRG